MRLGFHVALLTLFSLFAFACGTESQGGDIQPAGALQVTVANVQSVPGVDRIRLEGDGPTPFVHETAMNDRKEWTSFRGNLRVGTYAVRASALDGSGQVLYQSSDATVSVTANQTSHVVLVLNPMEDGQGPDNHVPFFESIAADKAMVLPGEQVRFTVQVHDRDGDALTLSAMGCEAGCGQEVGSFVPGSVQFTATSPAASHQEELVWTAPQTEGIYRIRFQVEDEHEASSTAELDIQVGEAVGAFEAEIRINFAPKVTKVVVSQETGDTILLVASADDDHSPALTFAWSNDESACEGTFSDPAAATTTFTVDGFVGDVERCTLTLTVTDGDGASTVTKIHVEKERFELSYAPSLSLVFQSQLDAAPGEILVFEVEAELAGVDVGQDPTFSWTLPGAAPVVQQVDDGLVSSLTWTATAASVACDPDAGSGTRTLTLHATATGASSGKTSAPVEFEVSVHPSICE